MTLKERIGLDSVFGAAHELYKRITDPADPNEFAWYWGWYRNQDGTNSNIAGWHHAPHPRKQSNYISTTPIYQDKSIRKLVIGHSTDYDEWQQCLDEYATQEQFLDDLRKEIQYSPLDASILLGMLLSHIAEQERE